MIWWETISIRLRKYIFRIQMLKMIPTIVDTSHWVLHLGYTFYAMIGVFQIDCICFGQEFVYLGVYVSSLILSILFQMEVFGWLSFILKVLGVDLSFDLFIY